MNYCIFGLGNVGSNVFKLLKLKKIKTFSKNNRFNCNLKFNYKKYEKLFKFNNLFIELIGGINIPYEIIINSILFKNIFITANKDLISKYIFFFYFYFNKINKKIFFEASVCGSLPIINLINNFYSKELIFYFLGVLNGTCNYILTNIKKKKFIKLIFSSIKKGFSEKNYEKDILGLDTIFKFSILISKINYYYINFKYIYSESIFNLFNYLRKFFFEKKYLSFYLNINNYIFINISLFLTKNIYFLKNKNSYNCLLINCKNSKKNFFSSLGAGGLSTSTSVLNDYNQSFKKNTFCIKKCFVKKKKIINKNFLCFNYLIKIKFHYNIFYFLFNLKIKIIKLFYKKYLIIKIKKTFYKKILFFLYFLNKKKFFLYKLL
ncbi:MAG: hypothetical protein ACH6QJ_00295 [Candidatus Carsonella ruddii]